MRILKAETGICPKNREKEDRNQKYGLGRKLCPVRNDVRVRWTKGKYLFLIWGPDRKEREGRQIFLPDSGGFGIAYLA